MGVDKRKPGRPTDLEAAKRILSRAGHISESPEPPTIEPETLDEADAEKRLTPRQALFVANLLRGMTQEEASVAANFRKDYGAKAATLPHVRAALERGKAQMVTDALNDAQAVRGLAIRRLRDVLQDPSAPHTVVVQAATTILDRTGLPASREVSVDHSGSIAGKAGPTDLAIIDSDLAALDAE
jgi:hypothetical protein